MNASEPVLVNLRVFVCVEILLFERPPVDDYEYINPCKVARSETAAGSGSDSDGSSDDEDLYANVHEQLSPSPSTVSPPTDSTTQLYSQSAKTAATSNPLKQWHSPEHDGAAGASVTIKPCTDRLNLMQQKKTTAESASAALSPTQTPRNKQPPRRGDDLIYEVVEDLLPNLAVKAQRKPTTDEGDSTRKSPVHQQTDLPSASAHVAAEPAKKPPPPPTKPKRFKLKEVCCTFSFS